MYLGLHRTWGRWKKLGRCSLTGEAGQPVRCVPNEDSWSGLLEFSRIARLSSAVQPALSKVVLAPGTVRLCIDPEVADEAKLSS